MKSLMMATALVASVCDVRGGLYTFSAITCNDTNGYAQSTGESQLQMSVVSLGAGQVSLVFTNAGPEESVISSIYFDFAPELSLRLASINNGTGVEFKTGPLKPENLPAGQGLDNVFISDLGVIAGHPKTRNGINPYETLELIMNYDGSFDLPTAFENESLRVGLHVQGFAGGYSESFVNVGSNQNTVPEPGTISMLLIGGIVVRWLRIR